MTPSKDNIEKIIAGRIAELEVKYNVAIVYNIYDDNDADEMEKQFTMDEAKRKYFEQERI